MVPSMLLAVALAPAAHAGKAPVVTVNGIEIGDPHRWLEDHEADETVAWWQERDAATRAKIADSAQIEAVSAKVRSWLEEDQSRARLVDVEGGVSLWRTPVRSAVEPNEDGAEHEDLWLDELAVRFAPDAELEPVAAANEGNTAFCAQDLDPSGRYLVFGRQGPDHRDGQRSKRCDLEVTELATGRTWDLFEGKYADPEWSPDGTRLMVAHEDGRKHELTEVRRDGEVIAERYRGKLILRPHWFRDDLVVAATRKRTGGGWTRDTRWYSGPAGALERVGYFNAMPRFGLAQPIGVADDRVLAWSFSRWSSSSEVVAVDLDDPWRWDWTTLVRPAADEQMFTARQIGDRVFAVHESRSWAHLKATSVQGGPAEDVELPGHWAAMQFVGDDVLVARGPQGRAAWDLGGEEPERLPWYSQNDSLVVDEIVVQSQDGTPIPVSLVHRDGVVADGSAPALLDVYGGFGHSEKVWVGTMGRMFLDLGGVVAVAHVRGGGELGEAWHHAAIQEHRHRTFEDVIASAEGLIDGGWTSPDKLLLAGASNGGLTVSNVAYRRPDLFGAVLSSAGVYDLMRGPTDNGYWWRREYGNGQWDRDEVAEQLLGYSMVHTTPERLPPMLVVTGQNDPNVPPWHSYKLVAAWENVDGGPVDLLVDPRGTHGGEPAEGTPPEPYWGEQTKVAALAWVLDTLGIDLG